MPRKEKRLKHIFTDDEIAALFEAAKHPSKTYEYQLRDLAIVALLLDTGVRASELRTLTIGNVTLARVPGEDSYITFFPAYSTKSVLLSRAWVEPHYPVKSSEKLAKMSSNRETFTT